MEFNNKLYELRKQRGFSQEELASRLNVSRQTVSKWEVGDSTPEMEKLVAISDLFGISLDELVMDKTPEAASNEPVKADLYTDIKNNVLTEENKEKTKNGLKIAAIVFGIIFIVDIISFVIYVAMFGLPH